MAGDLLLVGAIAALLFLPWLGARDLWNPNEPLYGVAVAEMAARGDWLVPTVNGEPFAEKPILYYWLALAAAAVGGVNEWTLRLPSAAAGIAAVCLLYALATPYVGRARGRLAGLLLATTFVVCWSARQVQMDLLLGACTLAAVLGATRALDGLWRPVAGWSLAGVAAGLGFLAKGPVGLVCPALAVVGYAAATGRAASLVGRAAWIAPVACAGVAAPWPLLLATRGPTGFLYELLVRQNLLRVVEPWDHEAPWWYYLAYLWIDMAPWSWLLAVAWALPPAAGRERALHRLAWTWLALTVLFFSLSPCKRSPYILPAAPAVALLAAAVVERFTGRGPAGRLRAGPALVAGLLGLLLAGGAALLLAEPPWVASAGLGAVRAARTLALVLALAAGLAWAGMLAGLRRPRLAPGLVLGALATVYLGAAAVALPAADPFKSARPFAEAIRTFVPPDAPLRGFHVWRWRAGYTYYVGRPIPHLDSLEALREHWTREGPAFVIVERGRLEQARRVLGDVEPVASRAVGSNHAYLFANDAGAARAQPE
jgi:4-amino-4-deoxy-L-arabinose transferase-like glycosyltransferase